MFPVRHRPTLPLLELLGLLVPSPCHVPEQKLSATASFKLIFTSLIGSS